MKTSRKLRVFLLALILLAILAGTALAAGETLPRSVADAGGESANGVGGLHLESAVGQPAAGLLIAEPPGGELRLCAGYLCGDTYLHVFMPIIDK